MGAFYTHIADAIVLNKIRRPQYAELTGGRSRRLSTLLIWFEYTCIPFARYVDWRARRFIERGIPIVEADLVPMDRVRPLEAPPKWRGIADETARGRVRDALRRYRAGIGPALGRSDFDSVARASAEVLDVVDAVEAETTSHFVMVRHFVESIGLAAANALRWREMSGGETDALARRFLRIQALGLGSVLYFDRLAQEIHAMGVGILLNDVPEIPFREKWATPTFAR
jgi:hypothetical protein